MGRLFTQHRIAPRTLCDKICAAEQCWMNPISVAFDDFSISGVAVPEPATATFAFFAAAVFAQCRYVRRSKCTNQLLTPVQASRGILHEISNLDLRIILFLGVHRGCGDCERTGHLGQQQLLFALEEFMDRRRNGSCVARRQFSDRQFGS